jgi:hypothetical protein
VSVNAASNYTLKWVIATKENLSHLIASHGRELAVNAAWNIANEKKY